MKNKIPRILPLIVALVFAFAATATRAQIIYSNLNNSTGQGYANGGAASNGSYSITNMVADDLTMAPGSGGLSVSGFTFTVSNFNTSSVSARPTLFFYANDGAGGGPGTQLYSSAFNALTFGSGVVTSFTFNPGVALFTVPANMVIWAGIAFNNNGTSATAAQLNLLGQGIFNPPTVGSSADLFFQTSAGGSANPGDNPAGGFLFFGGNPVANFGWQLTTTPTGQVPETGNTFLLLTFA